MSVWKSADTPPPDDREVLVAGYAADVTCTAGQCEKLDRDPWERDGLATRTCTAGQSEQRFICRFHESANEWKETHTEQRINVRSWTEIPGTGTGSQHAPVQRVSPSSVSSADFTNLPMNGKRH